MNYVFPAAGFVRYVKVKNPAGPSIHAQSGFSLVSLMVAMGVMSILALVQITMLELTFRGQRTATANLEANETVTTIQRLVNMQGSCDKTFAGIELDTELTLGETQKIKIAKILKGAGETAFTVYTKPPLDRSAYISDISLINTNNVVDAAAHIYSVALKVAFTKTGNVLGSKVIMPLQNGIEVFLQTDAAGKFQSCVIDPRLPATETEPTSVGGIKTCGPFEKCEGAPMGCTSNFERGDDVTNAPRFYPVKSQDGDQYEGQSNTRYLTEMPTMWNNKVFDTIKGSTAKFSGEFKPGWYRFENEFIKGVNYPKFYLCNHGVVVTGGASL